MTLLSVLHPGIVHPFVTGHLKESNRNIPFTLVFQSVDIVHPVDQKAIHHLLSTHSTIIPVPSVHHAKGSSYHRIHLARIVELVNLTRAALQPPPFETALPPSTKPMPKHLAVHPVLLGIEVGAGAEIQAVAEVGAGARVEVLNLCHHWSHWLPQGTYGTAHWRRVEGQCVFIWGGGGGFFFVLFIVSKLTCTSECSSLVPRPTPFFVLWFAFNITHGHRRAQKKWVFVLFRLRALY